MKFRLNITVTHWPLKEPFYITGHRFDLSSTLETTLHNGTQSGKGEASGVYYRGETAEQLSRAVEAMRSTVENGITRAELQHVMPPGGARNALDCALWDLEAAESGRPVWSLAGMTRIRPLMTTWTIGAATPEKMAATAREYQGARAIKLKLLGDGVDADRVRAVRRERPEVWLGVDANQGFTPDTLDAVWSTLLACKVKLVEQPFPVGRDEWLAARQRSIPFGADESLQSLADLDRIAELYDVVNIKLDKCGGLTEGLEIARQSRARGLQVMVGNMTGTSLGMAPAFVLGQLCDVVDLDGPIFLARDHVPGVHYRDGYIEIPTPFWGLIATSTDAIERS